LRARRAPQRGPRAHRAGRPRPADQRGLALLDPRAGQQRPNEELRAWPERLCSVGLAAGEDHFIIRGVAAGGHYTLEPQHNFMRDVKAADRDADAAFLVKATAYALRRGHISLRVLAGEDIRRIADACGTSTALRPAALPTRTSKAGFHGARRRFTASDSAWLKPGLEPRTPRFSVVLSRHLNPTYFQGIS
jgi:hypothetical protein